MGHKTSLTAPAIARAYSRRQMIAGSAIGLGSVAAAAASADAITTAKAIHQEEDFKANPAQIYEALLNAKQFSAFSGGRQAEIDRNAGGAFSLFAGHIVGRNLELVPDRRIVQAWRVVAWPQSVYSIARFELQGRGSETRVVFDHTGFPSDLAQHLEGGWQLNYWKPLQKYLG